MRLMTGILAATVALALPQASAPSVMDLLQTPGELTRADLEAIRSLTADLIVGQSFMSYGGFGGGMVTVGPGPRVRSILYGDRATEWPGLGARRCDGTELDGELILRWERAGSMWQVTAFGSTEPRVMDGMFDLWNIDAGRIEDAGFRDVDGVEARGLRYPYAVPQRADFEAQWQTIWFDTRTGLPLHYAIAIEGPEAMDYGYFLAWAPGWQREPAPEMERPDCVPTHGPRTGPQSPAERAELADALRRTYADADVFTLRADRRMRPTEPDRDRVTIVDLAPHEATNRVRWHRSITCGRERGVAEWECWRRTAQTLADVVAPVGKMVDPPGCPGVARNIEVGPNVPASILPEVADLVRSVGVESDTMPTTSCGIVWKRLGMPQLCEVSAVEVRGSGQYTISAWVGPAHLLMLHVRRNCVAGSCALSLSGCHDLMR